MSTTDILTGRVKWFDSKKGFGFITNVENNEQEYFVHHSRLTTTTNCFKTLYEGEYVLFEVVTENSKDLANNVRGIASGPLMCESRRNRPRTEESAAEGMENAEDTPINQ